ncbi:MAG TPA: DUF4328 domain-containing protein, partial [Streptomyces sp.]|nr:DUF4328 domain-containing protein [Streptomyces sp.]
FAWIIPVCNLFMPKQVVNDIWKASSPPLAQWYGFGPRPTVRRGPLNSWWTLWVIYFCLGSVATSESWYDAGSIDDARQSVAVSLLTDLFGIPAAMLALVVVNRLTRVQDDKLAGR